MAFLCRISDVIVDMFAVVEEMVGAGLFRLASWIHVSIIPENSSWKRTRDKFDML